MKRKIYERLLKWKREDASEVALLIDGARRVGKSWIAEVTALGDRSDIAARNAYLMKYWGKRKVNDAKRFADVWRQLHPGKSVPKHLEAYEVLRVRPFADGGGSETARRMRT